MVTSRLKEICLSAMENQFPDLEVLDFEIRKTYWKGLTTLAQLS